MEKLPEYLRQRKSDFYKNKKRDERDINSFLGLVVGAIVLVTLLDSGII